MGFGDSNLADNGRSRSEDAVGEASSKGITCSICLEHVSVGGDRSTATLRCGHQFHLDCVGSAFNYISTMQCPNCRQEEKGNWQFASGFRLSVPEFSVDDFIADEEIYDLNYPDSQRAGGVHFCPYRLGHFPFSYEDSDYTSPIPRYGEDEWSRYNGQIAEYLASPLYYHSFDPYSTQNIHRQPPPPPSSSASRVPNPWNSIPMPSMDSSYPVTFPAVDDPHHHQTWDSLSQYINHHINGNETLGSSTHVRAPTRLRSDVSGITQLQMHSLVSNLRNLSSSASSFPQYMENSHGHVARHENNGGSYTPNIQTSTAVRHGRMEQMFPPSEYSGFYNNRRTRRHENTEINMGSNNNHHYQWERDLLAPFPLLPVEGDFSYWDRLPLMTTETTGTTAPPPLDSGSNMFTSLWSQHYNGSHGNAAPSSNQPQPRAPPPRNINTSHQSDLQHFL